MPKDIEHTNENIYTEMCKLRYPVIATRKIDGIRGLRFNKTLLSRKLKQIPNKWICKQSLWMPGGMDVEICNEEWSYDYNESVIMSEEHKDQELIQFHILDWYMEGIYAERLKAIYEFYVIGGTILMVLPQHEVCETPDELLRFFLSCEQDNGEGICFRLPDSPYIQKKTLDNRSTLKEQYLVKLSRYIREEATIIGFEEQMVNCNPEKRDNTGRMNRSKAIGGMRGKNTLGALVVRTIDGTILRVSTGLTDIQRYQIWRQKEQFVDKQITFKHKPYGKKNKPRSPIWVGFRKDI